MQVTWTQSYKEKSWASWKLALRFLATSSQFLLQFPSDDCGSFLVVKLLSPVEKMKAKEEVNNSMVYYLTFCFQSASMPWTTWPGLPGPVHACGLLEVSIVHFLNWILCFSKLTKLLRMLSVAFWVFFFFQMHFPLFYLWNTNTFPINMLFFKNLLSHLNYLFFNSFLSAWYIHFKIIFIWMVATEFKQRSSNCWFTSQNALHSQGYSKLKPGAQNSI